MEFAGYEACHNEAEIIAASSYDPEADGDNPSGSVFCSHGAGYFVPWDQVKAHMHVESPCAKFLAAQTAEEESRPGTDRSRGVCRDRWENLSRSVQHVRRENLCRGIRRLLGR